MSTVIPDPENPEKVGINENGDVVHGVFTAPKGTPNVYPVGILDMLRQKNGWRKSRRYLAYQIKAGNWRAVRNHFNGYLAEHAHGGHNAGRGWTKRAALRRVERLCAEARQ